MGLSAAALPRLLAADAGSPAKGGKTMSQEYEIRTSPEVDKVFPALLEAHKLMGGVDKSQRNDYEGYKYAELKDYYLAARPAFAACGLGMVESAPVIESLPDRSAGNKTKYAVRVLVTMRVFHESGQWIEGSAWGEGVHHQDKAVYIATTGARKYLVAMMANLVTTDDPERYDASMVPGEVRDLAKTMGDADIVDGAAVVVYENKADCLREVMNANGATALSIAKANKAKALDEGWGDDLGDTLKNRLNDLGESRLLKK